MALFKNMAITYKGMALYAKAQAGQEIHFTKMKVGGGQIGTQNPATLTQLIDPKLDVPITSITAKPELKSAIIVGNVTNKDITEAMYICEIGLFATDPDEGEILYGYASCGTYGDYYPPATQGPFSWQYEIGAAIGNAANVIAELSVLQWDSDIKNSNTAFIKISGGNQKEINKSIDNYLNSLTNKIENIKVPVESVNSKTGAIELKAEDINCNDGQSVESHLEDIMTKQLPKKIDANNYVANNAFAVTNGSSTAYTITLNPVPQNYEDGMQITIKPHISCGDNPTLNINGLGALPIKNQEGASISSGNIKANIPVSLVRVGNNFFIRSIGSSIIPSNSISVQTYPAAETIKSGDIVGLFKNKVIKYKDYFDEKFFWNRTFIDQSYDASMMPSNLIKFELDFDRTCYFYNSASNSKIYILITQIDKDIFYYKKYQGSIGEGIRNELGFGVQPISKNKFLLIHYSKEKEITANIITINENGSLYFSKAVSTIFTNTVDASHIKLIKINNNKFLAFFYKGNSYAATSLRVFSVDGDSISAGNEVIIYDDKDYISDSSIHQKSEYEYIYTFRTNSSIHVYNIRVNGFNINKAYDKIILESQTIGEDKCILSNITKVEFISDNVFYIFYTNRIEKNNTTIQIISKISTFNVSSSTVTKICEKEVHQYERIDQYCWYNKNIIYMMINSYLKKYKIDNSGNLTEISVVNEVVNTDNILISDDKSIVLASSCNFGSDNRTLAPVKVQVIKDNNIIQTLSLNCNTSKFIIKEIGNTFYYIFAVDYLKIQPVVYRDGKLIARPIMTIVSNTTYNQYVHITSVKNIGDNMLSILYDNNIELENTYYKHGLFMSIFGINKPIIGIAKKDAFYGQTVEINVPKEEE